MNGKVWLFGNFSLSIPYNKGRSWHIVKLLVFHLANKRKPNRLKSKVFSLKPHQKKKVILLLNWPGFHPLTLCIAANEQDSFLTAKECLFWHYWFFITGWHHLSPSGVTFQSRWLDISHSHGRMVLEEETIPSWHQVKNGFRVQPKKSDKGMWKRKMIDGNFKLRRRPHLPGNFYKVFLHDK